MQKHRGSIIVMAAGLLCSYCFGAEFVDGPDVWGLWHMELNGPNYSAFRATTADDDSADPTRNHHMVLGGTDADPSKPVLVTGGLYGKALSMDGTDDVCYVQFWISGLTNDNMAVDLSFKANTVGVSTQALVSTGAAGANGFELRIDPDGRLTWEVWGTGGPDSIQTPGAISAGEWHTVHAALAPNALVLRVDDTFSKVKAYNGHLFTSFRARPHFGVRQITVAPYGERFFGGLLDEVKLQGNVPAEIIPPAGTLVVIH